jgi:LytS/YehU family sensor histidine kinase
MVGFDTGIRVAFKWSESEQEKNKLENENIKNQLAFLKHQVSPHFFMNTLNNIHSLIDINSEEAKEAIIKLSKMMRYLLYDSNENLVPISKEMEFNQSYINLMKLRFSDKVKIEVKIPQEIPPLRVHPMLFISLLENAFKHGISYKNESFIHIEWVFTPSSILFEISNSKHPNNVKEEVSGIGVENTRKRLELLYSNRYRMNIEETDTVYTVSLTLFT